MATLAQLTAWRAEIDEISGSVAAAQRAGDQSPNVVLAAFALARARHWIVAEIAGHQGEAAAMLNLRSTRQP